MGQLLDGTWTNEVVDQRDPSGRYERKVTHFRSWIRADGSTDFSPASDRYHLYVSTACPWSHKTVLARSLKGLSAHIGLTVVDPFMGTENWVFTDEFPDDLYGLKRLFELYTRAKADYTGRVSVPVLWDKQTQTLVSNESAEILEMFDSEFGELADPTFQLRPHALLHDIDAMNERMYSALNNGVYRSGFARSQEAYDEAVNEVFACLDHLESHLEGRPWLVGDQLTDSDLRLFATAIRFDVVYFHHFKCNRRMLRDYPHLQAHTRRVYALPGVAETVDFAQYKRHYYTSHESINPHRVIPAGPDMTGWFDTD